MNYKELLFDKDKVLSFYPELAVILNKYDKILAEEEFKKGIGDGKKRKAGTLGLNEAIIINQISYWNEINKKTGNNFKDGYYWTYNTYDKWAKSDFPYWSADTIRKSINDLEKMAVIISTDKYNTYKIDNTKWYRIDYDKLQKIIDVVKKNEKGDSDENEKTAKNKAYATCGSVYVSCIDENSTCTDGNGNLHRPIPEITSETTRESKGEKNAREGDCEQSQDQTNTQEWYTLKNQLIKSMRELGYKQGSKTTKAALSTFGYFILLRKKQAGLPYPKMTNNEMTAVAKCFLKARGLNNRALIEKYFEDGCGADDGWSVLHFMQSHVSDSVAVNT